MATGIIVDHAGFSAAFLECAAAAAVALAALWLFVPESSQTEASRAS